MLPRFGSAQPTERKRLLLLTSGNGTVLPHWRPMRDGRVLPSGDRLEGATSRILAPILERHAARTILIDGVDMAAAQGLDDGGHGTHQSLWTGRYGGGITYDGPGNNDGELPDGPSIDQVVAGRLGTTAVHSLQMAFWRSPYIDNRKIASYSLEGQPLGNDHNLEVIYERLFGGFVGPDPDRRPLRQRQSLAVLRGELSRLQAELPRDDRERLQQHLAGLEAFEARLDAAALTCDPGVLPDAATASAKAEADLWLIRQAFACDRTRVIGYSLTPEVNWVREEDVPRLIPGWSNATGEVHNTSHMSRTNPGAVEDMTRLKQWEAARVAQLIDLLEATPDGEGTLLDNTLVVWCTCMSHGGHHISRNTPAVVIHGSGGPWDTGRYLRSPGAMADITVEDWSSNSREFQANIGNGFPNNQLLVSIAQAFGVEGDTFGDPRFTGGLEGLS